MASLLFRLGRFSFRKKWWVISAWLVTLIAAACLMSALQPQFAKDFSLPGTDSGTATEQVEQYFPQVMEQQSRASTSVLVAADDGLAAHREQIDKLVADLRTLPDLTDPATVIDPLTVAEAQPAAAASVLGDNGQVGLIQVRQNLEIMGLSSHDKEALISILDQHRGNGLRIEATGSLMQVAEEGGKAEAIGFVIAFVVMIIAFGALIASFIPLVTGLVGVGLTIMLLHLSAEVISINESATGIVTMLGIALSIDYALFIVSRYRSELARGGKPEDAAGRAVGTAGSAVVFAGLTVAIAVAALMVIGIPLITQMGLGAAVAVVVAVIGALTLIPALLSAAGRFAFAPRIPWIKHAEPSDTTETNGVRFGRTVVRRPLPFIIVGLLALAVAAIPATKLELGLSMSTDAEVPAQQLLARGFGEGVNGPLLVVLHTNNSRTVAAAADATVAGIKTLPNVANASQLTWTGDGTQNPNLDAHAALISVIPNSSPSAEATHALMEQIRDLTPTAERNGAELHVGGQTAVTSDLSAKLSDALIPYLLVVIGLAFLIMILVFRSLWVPLIGTIGFVFSILATFGVTVAIFQEGDFGLISHTQPIISILPIFLIGVVFGLAMDYQVFLVTRMREEFVHGMNTEDAIIAGYRHGARVVSSAAVIMVSVFAAFMLSPDTTAKTMGFALAAAVLFDAFIIRMMVVPAVLSLLGDRAWRLPRWLDRWVPDVDIEGAAVRNHGIADTDRCAEIPHPVLAGAVGDSR